MQDWTLSALDPALLPSVLDLLRKCDLPDTGVKENPHGFIVASVDGTAIGCCGLERYGSDALLRSLAVDPMYRGRGIAAWLIARIVAKAEQERVSALYLLTTTARDYFTRHDFDVCPRSEAPEGIRSSWEFRTGCPDSATLMRRAVVCP